MPVVINEIVFKGEITESSKKPGDTARPERSAADPATLIQACVEEVMKILERKKER